MNTIVTILMGILVSLTLGLSAYSQEAKQESKAEKQAQTAGAEKKYTATKDADGIQRVEVTGGDYYFDPNYIVLKVNVPVEMKLKKAPGYVPHDIMVNAPEAGIQFSTDLDKEAKVVIFTPTKTGKYPMECGKKLLFFKSHKERGMHGMIEVIE